MSNPHAAAYERRIARLEKELKRVRDHHAFCVKEAMKRESALRAVSAKPLVNRHALAKKIVDYLFVDGFDQRASRLVMEYEGRSLKGSGWSERAMADRIEQILKGAK